MSGFKLKFESHFDIHSKKKGNDQELTKRHRVACICRDNSVSTFSESIGY